MIELVYNSCGLSVNITHCLRLVIKKKTYGIQSSIWCFSSIYKKNILYSESWFNCIISAKRNHADYRLMLLQLAVFVLSSYLLSEPKLTQNEVIFLKCRQMTMTMTMTTINNGLRQKSSYTQGSIRHARNPTIRTQVS